MLSTNKAKRDAELTRRVAAIGARLVEVDSSKYGSGLTTYSLYLTFDNDPGPAIRYHHGRELETPYHAYHVIIRGGAEKLDAITANPAHLAIHVYRERQDHHYKTRKIEDLQRALDYARKEYGRSAVDAAVASFRGNEDTAVLARNTTDYKRLREAVEAYDAAHEAMIAVIGEYPKSEDNYYPRY